MPSHYGQHLTRAPTIHDVRESRLQEQLQNYKLVKQIGVELDQKLDQKLQCKKIEDVQMQIEELRELRSREQAFFLSQYQSRSQFGPQYGSRYGPQ